MTTTPFSALARATNHQSLPLSEHLAFVAAAKEDLQHNLPVYADRLQDADLADNAQLIRQYLQVKDYLDRVIDWEDRVCKLIHELTNYRYRPSDARTIVRDFEDTQIDVVSVFEPEEGTYNEDWLRPIQLLLEPLKQRNLPVGHQWEWSEDRQDDDVLEITCCLWAMPAFLAYLELRLQQKRTLEEALGSTVPVPEELTESETEEVLA